MQDRFKFIRDVGLKYIGNSRKQGVIKMTENIFDLTDVSDIPDEISTELNCDVFGQNILTLFNKAGRNLTIDEITVGYYRQFKEIKTKRQIMGKLYNMARAREAKIKSISQLKGVYGVVK